MVIVQNLFMNSEEGERRALAEALRGRDPELLERLIDQYHYRLFRYLIYLTGNREIAEDLFQETWVRVLECGHQYDGRSKFDTWLFSISRHLVIDRLRSKKTQVSLEEWTDSNEPGSGRTFEPTKVTSPFDLISQRESSNQLALLLDRLPVPYREALVLRFQEEFSLEEIAKLVAAPISTVKSRIYRGIALLRESLEGSTYE